jgi:hypothetical protein
MRPVFISVGILIVIVVVIAIAVPLAILSGRNGRGAGNTVTITVQSANTKQLWMQVMQDNFNAQQFVTSEGNIMQVGILSYW